MAREDVHAACEQDTQYKSRKTAFYSTFTIASSASYILFLPPSFPLSLPSHLLIYLNPLNPNCGLPLAANATHPPIKHNPPSGVTGPKNLKRCGSSTSKYMDPLNIVMPAVKSDIARVFCGATTEAKVRTQECINYEGWVSEIISLLMQNRIEDTRGPETEAERRWRGEKTNLILRRRSPIPYPRWIRDALLQSVSAECAEHDARGAEEGSYGPERWHRKGTC